ncbi:MerR family transcriptional regulator [Flaviaesturariibacter flavus]|uniref:MerR family transcriptional regulator n=1 Tax=Flaviaesturariibacter flavus TaxID=2502780 RepID=A0A4R1BB43_9BACT|nr:MerR family transcriptional regulator [Flaviaesturariibacter flavus]TCJ14199.1 MerR family transcriptional regulator [Flaviaesturariibacter flavus]
MGFTIKELESLTGVKAHTIRIWEQRYGFLKPSRTSTNIRTYNNEELKTLLTVALLNKYGYKISRIDGMDPGQRDKEVLALQFEDARQEHLVNELLGCMVDMDAHGFETRLNGHLAAYGMENTILHIVFRFLEKTGILWQTGRVNPGHEHVVSNIVRQKVIAAIERLPLPDAGTPLMLLLLPEGEFHELGLLYVNYLLRRKGVSVLYLGANLPLKDALYAARLKAPEACYLHLTAVHHRNALIRFLNGLSSGLPDTRILLSGYVAHELPANMPSNLVLLQSLSAVHSYISLL